MKITGVAHTRFVPMFHPYYPQPAYNMKSCNNNYNINNLSSNNNNINNTNQMMFENNGLYESESEESFPASPDTYEDLNSIDFADLFNIQKHEQQEDLIQTNQLQMILEQVRREALQPLDVLEVPYGYNTSPIHTPECFEAVRRETYTSPNYTQLQPAVSPPPLTLQQSPQQQHQQQQQQVQRQELVNFVDQIKVEITKPSELTPKRRSSSDENNDKIRLYEFVLQLLHEERADCIRWLCPMEGEFEITNSAKIAQLWGEVKKNPTMTYEKFARALRHYYKLGILVNYKHKEKLRYKFSQDILLKNKKDN